jgi:hypothetical protein
LTPLLADTRLFFNRRVVALERLAGTDCFSFPNQKASRTASRCAFRRSRLLFNEGFYQNERSRLLFNEGFYQNERSRLLFNEGFYQNERSRLPKKTLLPAFQAPE